MLESFVKVYEDRAYRFPTLVNHGGTVVAFAMDDHRRIRYATLAMKPDDPLDVDGWPGGRQSQVILSRWSGRRALRL